MRFVLLIHDHPFLHWDLLLQDGERCRTWRLLASPETDGPITAEAIADHRLFYLDHEGPVSGDRGTVRRWDGGELQWLSRTDERIEVELSGARWQGRVTIERVADGARDWQVRLGRNTGY